MMRPHWVVHFRLQGTSAMEREFAKKVVLVTGATSGIGQAAALKFAAAGADIAAVGRNQEALAELVEKVADHGNKALTLTADLSLEADVDRIISQTVERFAGIDVVVNAAGHISSGTIENTTLAAWDAMLNINLRGVFLLM